MPRVTLDGTNPTQLTALLTTTLAKSRSEIVDNIFSNNPLLAWLRMSERVEYEDGGESIQIPLIYAKNSGVEAYRGYDRLNVDPQEGLTAAIYTWAMYHAPVIISGEELMMNRGMSALARLLDAKRVQATKSLSGRLNFDLINGNASDSKRLMGLADFVNYDPTAQTTYPGNILASDNAWWQNCYGSITEWWDSANSIPARDAGTLTIGDETQTGVISEAGGILAMTAMYNLCSDGADHPDLILTDLESFEYYERIGAIQGKNFTNTVWLDLGFTNIAFKGAAVIADRSIPNADTQDGYMYFLNSSYFTLVVHRQRDFTIREFGYPPDQDAFLSQIYWMGQLTCSNRRKQGVIIDTTQWT